MVWRGDLLGMLHEKVKGARLQKPTPDELRQLEAVRTSLRGLDSMPVARA
jgi:hypothetical protein